MNTEQFWELLELAESSKPIRSRRVDGYMCVAAEFESGRGLGSFLSEVIDLMLDKDAVSPEERLTWVCDLAECLDSGTVVAYELGFLVTWEEMVFDGPL